MESLEVKSDAVEVAGVRHIDKLIGDVAIQTAATKNTVIPTARMAILSPGRGSLVLMAAKNRATANRTTPST